MSERPHEKPMGDLYEAVAEVDRIIAKHDLDPKVREDFLDHMVNEARLIPSRTSDFRWIRANHSDYAALCKHFKR